jgi:hypothetical protein
VVFEAWDAERPATLSPIVVREIIRGRIGFDGLLFTDDIDMKALSGTPGEKASQALAAGCDVVLDCWARMDEMIEITGLLPDAGRNASRGSPVRWRRVLFRGVEKGVILLTATVVFKTSLFRSDICVWADGRVEMRDTELLVERLPVRPDCTPGSDPFHLASEGQLY